MRREVAAILDRVAAVAMNLDLAYLLERYPDDDVPFDDWPLSLGRPQHARAVARFRAAELDLMRCRNVTWDPNTGVCGIPNLCPECIRADSAVAD